MTATADPNVHEPATEPWELDAMTPEARATYLRVEKRLDTAFFAEMHRLDDAIVRVVGPVEDEGRRALLDAEAAISLPVLKASKAAITILRAAEDEARVASQNAHNRYEKARLAAHLDFLRNAPPVSGAQADQPGALQALWDAELPAAITHAACRAKLSAELQRDLAEIQHRLEAALKHPDWLALDAAERTAQEQRDAARKPVDAAKAEANAKVADLRVQLAALQEAHHRHINCLRNIATGASKGKAQEPCP